MAPPLIPSSNGARRGRNLEPDFPSLCKAQTLLSSEVLPLMLPQTSPNAVDASYPKETPSSNYLPESWFTHRQDAKVPHQRSLAHRPSGTLHFLLAATITRGAEATSPTPNTCPLFLALRSPVLLSSLPYSDIAALKYSTQCPIPHASRLPQNSTLYLTSSTQNPAKEKPRYSHHPI